MLMINLIAEIQLHPVNGIKREIWMDCGIPLTKIKIILI